MTWFEVLLSLFRRGRPQQLGFGPKKVTSVAALANLFNFSYAQAG